VPFGFARGALPPAEGAGAAGWTSGGAAVTSDWDTYPAKAGYASDVAATALLGGRGLDVEGPEGVGDPLASSGVADV
jgi:hypothetical protein